MKETITKKDNKQHINVFLIIATAIMLSKYMFVTGMSVGKMFYRLIN